MNNLKKIRRQNNISTNEIAQLLGVTVKEYKELESNPLLIPTSIACQISCILNCTVANIFLPIYLQNEDIHN